MCVCVWGGGELRGWKGGKKGRKICCLLKAPPCPWFYGVRSELMGNKATIVV